MVKSSLVFLCLCSIVQGGPVREFKQTHSGLTGIPDLIPDDVTHLDLSTNSIQWITQNIPSSVRNLNLESNELTMVPDYIFATNQNLESLNLKRNRIYYIAENAFASTRLSVLKLGFNVLPAIPSDSFGHIGATLMDLSLRGNAFQEPDGRPVEIPENAFQNCPGLKVLDLEFNRISHLSHAAFAGTLIEVLRLSYNDLRVVPSESLKPLEVYLKELDLSDNSIKSVGSDAFVDFRELEKIDMSGNKITHIEETAFSGTPLKLFYLGENALSTFPKFNTLEPSLEGLYLEHNNLRGFSGQELQGFGKLKYLSVLFSNISRFPDLDHVKGTLEWLNMNSNPFIENVPQDYFEGFQKLTHVFVSGGQKYFPNLRPVKATLSQVVLSSNEIRVIPADALGSLKQLKILLLDNNHIMQFPNISSLTISNLTLANNEISFVAPANIFNTTITSILDLSNNKLKTFPNPSCTKSNFNVLNLGNNHLECDCKLRWMKEAGSLGDGMAFADTDRLCVEPAILVLATWGLMQSSDFQCIDNTEAECENILAQEAPEFITEPPTPGGLPDSQTLSSSSSSSDKFTVRPASSGDTEADKTTSESGTFKETPSSTKSPNSAFIKTSGSGVLIGGIGAALSAGLLIIAITIFIVMKCRKSHKSKAIQGGVPTSSQGENGSVRTHTKKKKVPTATLR